MSARWWKKAQAFDWRCRDKHDAACRTTFLASDGWWGETYPQDTTRREIVIGGEMAKGAKLVVVAYSDPGEIHPSPRLADDTVNEELLKGNLPQTVVYDIGSWKSFDR